MNTVLLALEQQELEELCKVAHSSPIHVSSSLLDKLNHALERERNETATKAKGPFTEEQTEMVFNALLDHVVNGRPSDLREGHHEDWFFRDPRGHAVWNWRNTSLPLNEIARRLDLFDEYLNTNNEDRHKILERVKRHRLVKPIKERARSRNR